MKYYIIAGEASGDLHGSNLMKGIYAEDPQAEIRFWGGDCMVGVWAGFRNNPSHSYGAGPSLYGQRGSTVSKRGTLYFKMIWATLRRGICAALE